MNTMELPRLERGQRRAEAAERRLLTRTEVVLGFELDEGQWAGAVGEVHEYGREVILVDTEPALEHRVQGHDQGSAS